MKNMQEYFSANSIVSKNTITFGDEISYSENFIELYCIVSIYRHCFMANNSNTEFPYTIFSCLIFDKIK